MKYLVLLGDGMADLPLEDLGNKTPLEVANIPTMDYMAMNGISGLVQTIPQSIIDRGISPGSDIANLSVMGYDVDKFYNGRSPLEAVSMGIDLKEIDITFRCNLVTLSNEENYTDKTMIDYSAGEISTEEATELMKSVAVTLNTDEFKYFSGISYRHCLVYTHDSVKTIKLSEFDLTPPHDITGKQIADFLPKGKLADIIQKFMEKSVSILKNHPINKARMEKGLNPANSIWLWGEGKKPLLDNFHEKYGVKGSVISAVDLIKGLGISSGLNSIDVEGATGNFHTNFIGKANAALEAFNNGSDFVYLHIEAPDECGHQGQVKEKVMSIEIIDKDVLKPILEGLEKYEAYKVMLLPDHPTPLSLKTHTSDPVPFVIYEKGNINTNSKIQCYSEKECGKSDILISPGYTLMDLFLKGML